jgi:hypothetical protein
MQKSVTNVQNFAFKPPWPHQVVAKKKMKKKISFPLPIMARERFRFINLTGNNICCFNSSRLAKVRIIGCSSK